MQDKTGRKLFISLLALTWASASWATPFKYEIVSDHTNLLYACGELATFSVSVRETNGVPATSGCLRASLDNFGTMRVAERKVDLADGNVFTISGKLDEPGFLRLRLNDGSTDAYWSVGVEPEKIVKGSPTPEDFDAFWRKARERIAAQVPLDPKVERVPERCQRDFEFYRISFATWGRRVYGYMSVPTDRSRAPYPVHFEVSAAGFGSWTNNMHGSPDAINVFFSVYPFEPDWRWHEKGLKKRYDDMNAAYGEKYGCAYSQAGISEGPEKYFFYPVILGIDRAVDWVASRPDVDRRNFRYQGTSQGGGFGFYLCGLNRNFTRGLFLVPAITDTMGSLKGRQSGWPSIVESQRPEAKAAACRWAPYFDGANFAARITCPVRVAVGFADMTCAPCAVYASYNEIKVKDKGIKHCFGMGHHFSYDLMEDVIGWLNERQ